MRHPGKRSWQRVLFLIIWIGLLVSLSRLARAQGQNGPVVLYFIGTPLDGTVMLEWETATEFKTLGFTIDRADTEAGPYKEQIGFIPAIGGPTGAHYEEIDDVNIVNGQTYWYILNEFKTDKTMIAYGPISVTVGTSTFNNYIPVSYSALNE